MKRITHLLILAVVGSFFLVPLAGAQEGISSMGPWVISAGGRSETGIFTVQGAAGDASAGASLQGGNFTLKGGMWSTTGGSFNLLLPIVILGQPIVITPPPTPPAVWQRIGDGGLMVAALAIQETQLFAADRRNFADSGGLYRRNIATCESTLTTGLTRFDTIQFPGFGIVFQDAQGVLAAFGGKIFYSADGGNSWVQTVSNIPNPRTVARAGNAIFYAGTDESGIYRTEDGGVTWQQRTGQPAKVNVIRLDTLDPNTLWIGTEDDGVWVLTVGLDRLTERNSGLDSANSRKVWDFDFDSSGAIYVATYDGIFKGNGAGAWQPFGLQGAVQARSLAVAGDQLYAGAQSDTNNTVVAGVWRRPLNGGDWAPILSTGWNPNYTVRDLLYDSTYCKGVLAATNDGVWLYK